MEGHNSVKCPQKVKDKEACVGGKDQDKGKRKAKSSTSYDPKCKRKNKSVVGMGLFTEFNSGNTTLNPGTSSERIITQRCPIASQSLTFNPDPTTRYPVPSERAIREELEASSSAQRFATRRIAFAATGLQPLLPTNLPFKPPGPTWNGKPCTTKSALEKTQREKKKGKK